MKPPKAITISPVGLDNNGDLRVSVTLRRRSMYAFRLLYRSLRAHGGSRAVAASLAFRVVIARGEPS